MGNKACRFKRFSAVFRYSLYFFGRDLRRHFLLMNPYGYVGRRTCLLRRIKGNRDFPDVIMASKFNW